MKSYRSILLLLVLLIIPACFVFGQNDASAEEDIVIPPGGARLPIQVIGSDTFYLVTLRTIHVYPPMVFKSKKDEKFYWKTVRDVKKALPYARLVSSELISTNRHLATLSTDKERKDYLEQYEKDLFKQYESELRKLTFNQGKLLLRLIDRECDKSSFELIKNYRGGVSAFFWQGIAKIFGADLKSRYDVSKEEDKMIERIIALVENGQL